MQAVSGLCFGNTETMKFVKLSFDGEASVYALRENIKKLKYVKRF